MFDGVEMSMTLMKVLRKHFGTHLLSLLRFPPLQKFEIWIHLYAYGLNDLEQGSFADYFVLDTHGFVDVKKHELFQSFETLKNLKQSLMKSVVGPDALTRPQSHSQTHRLRPSRPPLAPMPLT